MSTFKNKNNLRTIEAQIVQKLKNNEAWPRFTGSYKKKRVFAHLFPCLILEEWLTAWSNELLTASLIFTVLWIYLSKNKTVNLSRINCRLG